MPEPAGLERATRVRRGRWGSTALLLLATARCTFPDYDVVPPMGTAGSGASSGAGAEPQGGGASGGTSGAQGGTSTGGTSILPSAAGAAGALEDVGCAPEQWPVDHCQPGCLHRYPDHCYNTKLDGDEVDLNCGGGCQACTIEACSNSRQCLSGQCVADASSGSSNCYAPLSILYTAHERNASVGSTAWSIKLTNSEPDGGESYLFKDLKLRYYFDRTDLVEPIIVRATQSNLRLANGQTRELMQTSWNIERTEGTPDVVYDAYVEVGFADGGQFFPGDSVDLYQQMLTGDPSSSNFDQRANYSFSDQIDSAFLHVVVLYQGKLVWGLEPRPANPRACFYRGVNFNGPAVSIDGNAWQSSMQANVAPGGGSGVSQDGPPFPPATGGLATMMQTAFRLSVGSELSMPADNGTYLLYLYAVSPTASDATPSSFTVQGADPVGGGKFRSQASDGGQAWARLGPYRVSVTDGKLQVGVTSGAVNFAGLELWYPE